MKAEGKRLKDATNPTFNPQRVTFAFWPDFDFQN
jgi:hypothetical protein